MCAKYNDFKTLIKYLNKKSNLKITNIKKIKRFYITNKTSSKIIMKILKNKIRKYKYKIFI